MENEKVIPVKICKNNKHLGHAINDVNECPWCSLTKIRKEVTFLKTKIAEARPYMKDFTEHSRNNGFIMRACSKWLEETEDLGVER